MDNMLRCRDCRWWNVHERLEDANVLHGTCYRLEAIPAMSGVRIAFAEYGNGHVNTPADFGCVRFEAEASKTDR